MLSLVKCVKVRSLVSGDEGFCRVIDFAYVFVDFAYVFVKLYLIKAKKPTLLNKRTELISKCRHENKFYLANFELNCQQ